MYVASLSKGQNRINVRTCTCSVTDRLACAWSGCNVHFVIICREIGYIPANYVEILKDDGLEKYG